MRKNVFRETQLQIRWLVFASLISFTIAGSLIGCQPGRIRPSNIEGPISVRVADSEITLSNHTDATAYYVIYPSEILPRIEWYPCNHPERCGESFIEVDTSVTLDIHNIAEKNTETLAIFWWHLEATNGEYEITDFAEIYLNIR